MPKRSIGIIGTGRVGASVAVSALQAGLVEELLLHDMRTPVAEGEAMDLAHGAGFYPAATIRAASLEDIAHADAIVVAAGHGGRPGESRLDLLRDNAALIRDLGTRLTGYTGIIVIVSNPVDVLTYVMTQASGLPPARVLGTGTMLDTARLREALGRELQVSPHSIHAQVIGEHGDSEVALWTGARVGGIPLRSWPNWQPQREQQLADEVRTAAYEIIQRKGATNHAIGLVTAALLRSLLRDERRVLTVSRVQEGAAGIHDVALSLPAIVGSQGAVVVLEPEMSREERDRLMHSADILCQAATDLKDDAR